MFSLIQRFQTVSNVALTYFLVACLLIIGASHYQLMQDQVKTIPAHISNIKPFLKFRTSRYMGSTNNKPKENARITFDLDTDLSKLFNWNTKQLFVFLTAEYPGDKNPSTWNEVTFWDKIITNKEDAVLQLHDAKSKYTVWDLENRFNGRELTFKLHWNIQPWVGPLMIGETIGNYTTVLEKEIAEVKHTESQEKHAKKQEEMNDN